MLESDADRRSWKLRGPYCEGWPIYHAVHDPVSGSIYAAAASEWHGAGVWRSADLGETWELSSEGLSYGERRAEALEDLRPDRRARPPAGRRRGLRRVREPRRRRDLVAAQHARRPARPRRLERSRQSAARAPRPAGAASASGRRRPASGPSSRASASSRRPTTARRGRRATAGCAPTGRSRIPRWATACTSS